MTDSDFDNICDRFDASWREGKPLRIEDLLTASIEASRDDLLRALLEIELEYRIRAGEAPTVEDYAARFPQQQSLLADALASAKRRIETSIHDVASTSAPAKGAGLEESGATRRVIGPYKLLQQIGEGGMGTVYMAEQTKPVRRRVALKVVKSGLDRKEILSRFEAERQALAMMDHPNIAKVLDAGSTDDGLPFFVMELVNGIPITEFCDKYKLSLNERLQLFVQSCRAIQHAHQKGIIHRDVKPSNVLVTQHDGVPVAKVIDFGLAKALQNSQRLTDKTMFTEFGQVVGTLQYMSPEQSEMNALDIDTRSDVYSLGVLLYELLTGTTPIEKEALKQMALDRALVAIREEEAPRPSLRLSSLGDSASTISLHRKTDPKRLGLLLKGDLDWIAIKALEKDRNRRYQSAHDLADDVGRFLSNEPVEARSPSLVYRLQKLVAKHRRAAAVTFTLLAIQVAILAGSTAFFWWRAKEFQEEVVTAEKKLSVAEMKRTEAKQAYDLAVKDASNAKNELAEARQDMDGLRSERVNAERRLKEAIKNAEAADRRLADAKERFKEENLTAEAAKKANRALVVANKELETSLNDQKKASYHDKIRLATNALNRNDFRTYLAALKSCPEDLRGWEHDYLYSLTASGRQLIKNVNCYAANDKYLVVGSKRSTIDIYEIESGKQIRQFDVEIPAQSLSIAPTSDVFMAVFPIGDDDKKTKCTAYTVSKGSLNWTASSGSFSPDGQQIAYPLRGQLVVANISAPTEPLLKLDSQFRLGFWCGPLYLAVERAENEQPEQLYFWDRQEGSKLVRSDIALPSGWHDLQPFGLKGNFAVRTATDSFSFFQVNVDTAKLKELRKLHLPGEAIDGFCFEGSDLRYKVSPELRKLALFSSCEPRVNIYDISPQSNGELIGVISTGSGIIDVQWCKNSSEIALVTDQARIETYELDGLNLTDAYAQAWGHYDEDKRHRLTACGNQGQYIVFWSGEHADSIEVRSVRNAASPLRLTPFYVSVKSVPQGIYATNSIGEIYFVSSETSFDEPPKKVLRVTRDDAEWIWGVEWLSDRHVAVLLDGMVEIWDVQTKQRLLGLASVKHGINLAWSPVSRRLAASSWRHVFIWDFPASGVSRQMHPTRVLELPLDLPSLEPRANFEFSPDGRHLIASSVVWNLDVDRGSVTLRIPTRPGEKVTRSSFTLDGKFLVLGMSDGVIRKLHFPSLKLALSMNGLSMVSMTDPLGFSCLQIDRRGNLFAALDNQTSRVSFSPWNSNAKLWDLSDGTERMSFKDIDGMRSPFRTSVLDAHFSDDGRKIFAVGTRGEIRVLDASIKMGDKHSIQLDAPRESAYKTPSTESKSKWKNLIDLETPPPANEFVVPGTSEGSDAPKPKAPPAPPVPDPAPASDHSRPVEDAPLRPANAGERNP